jgi:deazaflavin-dependent oxidoreductase (nitroreductase family)
VPAIDFRAPALADARTVLALLIARNLADHGRPDMSLAELEEQWSAESFDLGADAIVAQASDGHRERRRARAHTALRWTIPEGRDTGLDCVQSRFTRPRRRLRSPMSTMPADFNAQIIDEFRANAGRVGGMFEGAPLLLLHHTGAKSGAQRVAPLVYLRDGDRYVIFGSKAGAPTNPGWYHNLLANPDTEIEVGTETIPVRATEITGEERDRLFEAQVQRNPGFADYEKKTDRVIPAIALTRR